MKTIDKFRFMISMSVVILSIINIIILYNVHNELQDVKSSIRKKHGSIEIKKNNGESNDLPNVMFNEVDSTFFNH